MATSESDCEDFESADEGDMVETNQLKEAKSLDLIEPEKTPEAVDLKSNEAHQNTQNEEAKKASELSPQYQDIEVEGILMKSKPKVDNKSKNVVVVDKPKEDIENLSKPSKGIGMKNKAIEVPKHVDKDPKSVANDPKPKDLDPKPEAIDIDSKSLVKDKISTVNEPKDKVIDSKSEGKYPKAECKDPKTAVKETIKDVPMKETAKLINDSSTEVIKSAMPKDTTRILEDSKSRAKSEEKPEIVDSNVKVARKLSNPEKTTRVMLHIEKKALADKNAFAKNQTQLTEKETSVLDRLSAHKDEKKISPGWGGLGNWGTSFISSAASSVSTFTSHVTQGIETVIESVEATLGAPSPEELAANLSKKDLNEDFETETKISSIEKQDSAESSSPKSIESHEGILPGSLLGGVSAITRALESTGSKVISGGLDTLELIGKKTIDILTEGDPGLRNKRNIFSGDDTTLSQVLREARDRLESASINDESFEDPFPVHYSKLFDEFQGLVHLEALEMLSSQSKMKLQDIVLMLETDGCDQLVATMEEIRHLCEDLPPTDDTPDEEASQDFNKLLTEHVSPLPFKLNVDKIKTVQVEAREWVDRCKDEQEKREVVDAKEIYIKAITVLAKLSACMMELYHKIAELLLVSGSPIKELRKHCKHLTSLTTVLNLEIQILTSSLCHCLNTAADDSEDPDAINPFITQLYLEASNSNSYIQEAFSLLIPVLQEIASKSIET